MFLVHVNVCDFVDTMLVAVQIDFIWFNLILYIFNVSNKLDYFNWQNGIIASLGGYLGFALLRIWAKKD